MDQGLSGRVLDLQGDIDGAQHVLLRYAQTASLVVVILQASLAVGDNEMRSGLKLLAPGSNRFVGHRDATLREKVLDIAEA